MWNTDLKQKLHFLLLKCAAAPSCCRNRLSGCKMVFNKRKVVRLIPQCHFLGLLTNCGLRIILFDDFLRKIRTLFHVLLNAIFWQNAINLKNFLGCRTCWELDRREAVPGMQYHRFCLQLEPCMI